MPTAQILNLGQVPPAKFEDTPPPVEDEFTRTRDLVDQTQSDVRRMRMQMERQQDEQESHQARTKVLSIILGILIVSLAAALWFAYPAWKEEKKAVADMLGLQNTARSLGE